MTFSEDSDLLKKRPGILNQGVDSFKDQQIEAARIIRRDLSLWYQARGPGSGTIEFRAESHG